MKLLVPLYDLNQMKNIAPFVDGFLLGNDQFGTRLTKSHSVENIKTAIKNAKFLGKEAFLVCNQMMTDVLLESFKGFIQSMDHERIDGVIVGDLGALSVLTKMGLSDKAIYNPETLLTNVYDVNFLNQKGIKGVYLAKEITLEDIETIAKEKKLQLFMVGHGHLNMFYSRRQLVDNFTHFIEKENVYHKKQDLKIVEDHRSDEPYPILEDDAGTHVFRSHVFSALNHLDTLEPLIDYIVLDTLFKDDMYTQTIAAIYKENIQDESIINELKETYQETWDDGFFYKKTIYKQKG